MRKEAPIWGSLWTCRKFLCGEAACWIKVKLENIQGCVPRFIPRFSRFDSQGFSAQTFSQPIWVGYKWFWSYCCLLRTLCSQTSWSPKYKNTNKEPQSRGGACFTAFVWTFLPVLLAQIHLVSVSKFLFFSSFEFYFPPDLVLVVETWATTRNSRSFPVIVGA